MASVVRPRDQLVARLQNELRKCRAVEGAARFELGRVVDQVIAGSLWLVWPRSVVEKDTRGRVTRPLGTVYRSFDEWAWNEAGSSPGRLRGLAADHRRLRAAKVRSNSKRYKRLSAVGVGKFRAIMRGVDHAAADAHKSIDTWLERVETLSMTEAQLRAWLTQGRGSVPEGRMSAIAMPAAPRSGRPAQWRAVDKALVKAAEYACVSDKTTTLKHINKVAKLLKDIR